MVNIINNNGGLFSLIWITEMNVFQCHSRCSQIRWLIGIKYKYLAILVPAPTEHFSILFEKQKQRVRLHSYVVYTSNVILRTCIWVTSLKSIVIVLNRMVNIYLLNSCIWHIFALSFTYINDCNISFTTKQSFNWSGSWSVIYYAKNLCFTLAICLSLSKWSFYFSMQSSHLRF